MGESYKDSPMVGVPGFEPGASWTRTKRDTKLRHVPIDAFSLYYFFLESQGHYQILEQGMFNRILGKAAP